MATKRGPTHRQMAVELWDTFTGVQKGTVLRSDAAALAACAREIINAHKAAKSIRLAKPEAMGDDLLHFAGVGSA